MRSDFASETGRICLESQLVKSVGAECKAALLMSPAFLSTYPWSCWLGVSGWSPGNLNRFSQSFRPGLCVSIVVWLIPQLRTPQPRAGQGHRVDKASEAWALGFLSPRGQEVLPSATAALQARL